MPHQLLIVVDVFRAATTACHVLAKKPRDYLYAHSCAAVRRLRQQRPDAVLIGRPELGSDLCYDLPSSPTLVDRLDLAGRVVVHRTQAGALGILRATPGVDTLLAGFVNASATAELARGRSFGVDPMGHEGARPSLEDDLAAACIEARVSGAPFDLGPHVGALRAGSGRYFFGADQTQYPRTEFDLCLRVDAFDFAVLAERDGDYARLRRVRAS